MPKLFLASVFALVVSGCATLDNAAVTVPVGLAVSAVNAESQFNRAAQTLRTHAVSHSWPDGEQQRLFASELRIRTLLADIQTLDVSTLAGKPERLRALWTDAADAYTRSRNVIVAHRDEFAAADWAELKSLDDDALALARQLRHAEALVTDSAATVGWLKRVVNLATAGAIIAAKVVT